MRMAKKSNKKWIIWNKKEEDFANLYFCSNFA